MQLLLTLIAAAWLGYCVWRVATSERNAIQVGADVSTACPTPFAWQTYLKVREFYLQLSPGHRKYEMSGENLLRDVVIDVWETAGFQFVKHRYRVAGIEPERRMNLVSDDSRVVVLGLFRGHTRSEVEFRFAPEGTERTALGLTIRIVFPNVLRQLLARLFFTEAIWQRHAHEEMKALAAVLETRFRQARIPAA